MKNASSLIVIVMLFLGWGTSCHAVRYDGSVYVDKIKLSGNCNRYIQYVRPYQKLKQFAKFDSNNQCILKLTVRRTTGGKIVRNRLVKLRHERCELGSCPWSNDARTDSTGEVSFDLRGYEKSDDGCGFFLNIPLARDRYPNEKKCYDYYGDLKEIEQNGMKKCLARVHEYPVRFIETYRNCNYP